MHNYAAPRSLVGSLLIGIITSLLFISLFTSSITTIALLLAAVAITVAAYYRPAVSPFILASFLLLPALQFLFAIEVGSMPFNYLGLTLLFLLFGSFIFCTFDWIGAYAGLWIGLALPIPYSAALVLPAIAAVTAFRGVKAGVACAGTFSLFGMFFMLSLGFGLPVPAGFESYSAFFPDTAYLASLYFPSMLFSSLLGPQWVDILSSSSANILFSYTPLYFVFISAIVIVISHYGKRLVARLHLNSALCRTFVATVGCVVAGALLFGSYLLLAYSALAAAMVTILATSIKPLLGRVPRLSSSGLRELVSGPAIVDGINFEKSEGVMIESKPSKSTAMSNCWDRTVGVDGIKNDLLKAVALPLRHKREAQKFGIRPARGILIYGPPGTGKTTLLRGLASQLGIKYIEINPSEVLSKWYGESEHRMSEVFKEARASAPSILAINDIDGLGKERTSYKSDDVTPRVLTVMLSELDNMLQSDTDAIVVATTNKPQMLDKALIRPGRFDKIIYMGPPDAAAREAIFRHYLEGKPTVSADINYPQLASSSERFTGADIRAVVDKVLSGAFYSEVKDKKEALITQEMLAEAIKTTRPSIDFSMLEEYERFRATYQRDRLVTKGWESEIPDVRFEDIGDLDQVKTELRESFELPLRRPDLMEKLKVRPVKGVLLYGPPGNGKTLLAKAVATEVSANFFIISGAELAKTGANDAASKVKDLFNLAKENVPAIIFIDEIDQLAPDRSSSEGSAFVPVTTQLLSELDGVKALKGVMILAATNRPEAIDQALLRANRIEKHVLVPPPDERGREEILGIYLRDVKLSDDVIIKELAKMTDGFSGADLQGFVNEAKKSVIRSSLMGDVRDWLNMGDFKAALQAKAASSIKRV